MKLSLLQIIKEEVENFFNNTQQNGEPSMADNYYNKLVGASQQKPEVSTPKISGELIGQVDKQWDTPLEIPIPVYKNPTNLMGFSNNARGILLNNGDLYLGQTYNALHDNLLTLLAQKRIISYDKQLDYSTKFPEEFVAVIRTMHTNYFSDSSEYKYSAFPEYYAEIFNLANQKQPFRFMPLPRTGNVEEIESPVDPNNMYSNIPQGYDGKILN